MSWVLNMHAYSIFYFSLKSIIHIQHDKMIRTLRLKLKKKLEKIKKELERIKKELEKIENKLRLKHTVDNVWLQVGENFGVLLIYWYAVYSVYIHIPGGAKKSYPL